MLLIALGSIAVLPPFEGFDENAHYSSIQQIADTGTIPRYGQSFLSTTVVDYRSHGPSPYNSLTPPFDQNNGMTYAAFFNSQNHVEAYKKLYRESHTDRSFEPSREANWQAQHPPLYYLLMAPFMKATASCSMVTQLFLLRLISFLLAFFGFLVGLRASLIYLSPKLREPIILGFLLYPFIAPMFFPEFARLGNDSLCLLLFAGVWAFLLRCLQNENDHKASFFMGIMLGLGLLTKAFFIPIEFGIGMFMLAHILAERGKKPLVLLRIKQLIWMFIPALLLGGSWYVNNFLVYGSFVGGDDVITLAKVGGLLENLEGNFSFFEFVRGIAATLVMWSWAGTWSLTRINEIFRIPLLALTIWLFCVYLRQAWQQKLTHKIWLPMWLSAPFFAGLIHHIFVGIALKGSGATPGWYIHILAPVIALMFAFGLAGIKYKQIWQRILLNSLLAYTVFFLILVNWMQMLLFAGFATKGDNKYYQLQGSVINPIQAANTLTRLDVLGWPLVAVICYCVGLLCLSLGLITLFRAQMRENNFA
jgi:hypothetical protein